MRLILSMLLLLTSAAYAEKKAIMPPGAATGRPFSQGILVDGTLYVAGQTGADKKGVYPEKFEDEVKQTLDNVNEVLKAAGFTFADAVSVQVYLTDMTLFPNMNSVYTPTFPEPRPVRTTVGVAKLVGKARVEITVTARK